MDLFGRRRDYSAVAASLPVSRCGCPESRTRPRLPQARINTATETPSAGPAAAAGRNRDSGRSALHRHRLRRPRPAAGAAVTVTSEFLGRRRANLPTSSDNWGLGSVPSHRQSGRHSGCRRPPASERAAAFDSEGPPWLSESESDCESTMAAGAGPAG